MEVPNYNPSPLIPITGVDSHRQLVDEQGNVRFFRGMSVANKAPPYLPILDSFDPIHSFCDIDIDLFSKLNLNVIRLPVPWAAVQPNPGPDGYDLEYLAKVKDLVERCGNVGIYVLIECHQDLYAEKFCGNGMPAWSIAEDSWTFAFPWPVSYPRAKYENPDSNFPSDNTCGPCGSRTRPDWGRFYGSDAVTRAFFGLYTQEEIQGPFVAYWEKLAQTFTGMPNIIGYELLNEPFIASKTSAGVPLALWYNRAKTESRYLEPLYTRISAAIRKYDTRTLIWWEPVTGGGGNSGQGFKDVPEGVKEKSVMSFHSYGPNSADKDNILQAIETRMKQVKKIGGGLVLTEFDCELDRGMKRIRHVMELCDQKLISWIGWQYKEFVHVAGSPPSGTLFDPKTSQLRPKMMHLFSRPYPSSVAGKPNAFSFDYTDQTFILEYTPSFLALRPNATIISINEDEIVGWGEWLVGLERVDGENVDESLVEIKKVPGSVQVIVREEWKGDLRIVLKQKNDVKILD